MKEKVSKNSSSMRVASLMEEGRFSGQHNRIIRVAARLKERHIETIVYFPREDSEFFEQKLNEHGIEYRLLRLRRPTLAPKAFLLYFIYFFPDVLTLAKQLKNDFIDLAHCNGSWQIKAPLAAWLAGVKVLWHLNDTKMPSIVKRAFSVLAWLIADFLVLASQRVQTYYLDNNSLRKIPHMIIQAPVDTQRLDPDKPLALDVDVFGRDRCLRVVFISNITPVKGVEYFIEMAGLLSAKRNDIAFHLFGRCYKNQQKYIDQLEKMIHQLGIRNFHWHGFRSDVINLLGAADVFVCTSLYEASPTVVWEAMSMARAIVATDVGDVSCIIENGKSGFVVPTRDPVALAQKVEILLGDPDLRRSFGREARCRAKALLDVSICAERHEEAYRRTLSA